MALRILPYTDQITTRTDYTDQIAVQMYRLHRSDHCCAYYTDHITVQFTQTRSLLCRLHRPDHCCTDYTEQITAVHITQNRSPYRLAVQITQIIFTYLHHLYSIPYQVSTGLIYRVWMTRIGFRKSRLRTRARSDVQGVAVCYRACAPVCKRIVAL